MANKFKPGDVVKIEGSQYVILEQALAPESESEGLQPVEDLYRVVRIEGPVSTIDATNFNKED